MVIYNSNNLIAMLIIFNCMILIYLTLKKASTTINDYLVRFACFCTIVLLLINFKYWEETGNFTMKRVCHFIASYKLTSYE